MEILILFLIVILKAVSALVDGCLLYKTSTDGSFNDCLMCDNYYYLSEVLEGAGNHICKERITLENYYSKRTIAVLARNISQIMDIEKLGLFDAVYDNLITAVKSEKNIGNKIYAQSQEIYIKFLKGDHYILPADFDVIEEGNFFWRTAINIYMEPFFCKDGPDTFNESLCYEEGNIAKIYFKFVKFKIFASKTLVLRNLIFDGIDSPLYYLKDESCMNSQKLCCASSNYNCSIRDSNPNLLGDDLTENRGILTLEPIFNSSLMIKESTLILVNITIINMNLAIYKENELYPNCLISMSDFKGTVSLANVLFEKSIFPKGIINKMKGIRAFFQKLTWLYANNNFQSLICKIDIKNTSVYNSLSNQGNNYLYFFNEFDGYLNMNRGFYSNCSYNSFIYLKKDVNNQTCYLKIEELGFKRNTFLIFINLNNTYRGFAVDFVLIGNQYQENLLQIFAELVHVSQFYISENFTRDFILPVSGLIVTAFSKIIIEKANFQGLIAPYPEYSLIRIVSDYTFSSESVFLTAKRGKGVKYANDSTEIKGSNFFASNFLLLDIIKLNYELHLEDLLFDEFNILIHIVKPFIRTVSEANLVVKNVSFMNFESAVSLISIENFLNITIKNLSYFNIKMLLNYILFAKSTTLSDPSEHQINFTCIFIDKLYLGKSSSNFFLIGLFVNAIESGKGPAILLENSVFTNLFSTQNSPFFSEFIRFMHSNFFIKNVSTTNISNFVFISNEPRVSTASLIFQDILFINNFDYAVGALLTCGIAYYKKIEILNSIFVNLNVVQNTALSINFGQSFFMISSTFLIKQGKGNVIFSQVQNLSNFLISNVKIELKNGSTATILSLATENPLKNVNWTDFKKVDSFYNSAINFTYGIKNCAFKGSMKGAIALLPQAEIIIVDSIFSDMAASEGAFLTAYLGNKIVLRNCELFNMFSATTGGTIYGESSLFYLFNIKINSSSCLSKGGAMMFVDSQVYIKQSEFKFLRSVYGGMLFAEASIIMIDSSVLNYSTAHSYGGHIVMKSGELLVNNCILTNSSSKAIGGSLMIENTFLQLLNSEISLCSSSIGILYISGASSINISSMYNIRIYGNSVKKTAAAMLLNDVNLNLSIIDLADLNADDGFLVECLGIFSKIKINFYFFRIANNSLKQGLINLNDVEFQIVDSIFYNNTSLGTALKIQNAVMILIGVNFHSHDNNIDQIKALIFGDKSTLSLSDSSINLKNLQNLAYGNFLIIYLKKTIILNGKAKQGGSLALKKSSLEAEHALFTHNLAMEEAGAIFGIDTSVILRNTIFWKNFAFKSGSDIKLMVSSNPSNYKLEIENSLFFGVISNAIQADGIQISINLSVFYGSKFEYCQAIVLKNSLNFSIINSFFYRFRGLSAVSVSNEADYKTSLLINFSSFQEALSPEDKGSFLFLSGNIEGCILNTVFSYGFARAGGAIFISCLTKQCSFIIKNSSFFNNRASFLGGAISSGTKNLENINNIFKNNSALVGNDTNYFPSKLNVFISNNDYDDIKKESISDCVAYNCTKIINKSITIIPGRNFSFGVVITDDDGNIQYDQHETFLKIGFLDKSLNETYNLRNDIVNVEHGIGIFHEVVLSGPTNSSVQIIITYSYKKQVIYKILNFELLACVRGETFQDGNCVKCKEHFFSLYTDKNCEPCPYFAYCPGGDIIFTNKEYWRRDANSSVILPCKMKKACISQNYYINKEAKNYKFRCEEGYEGNLCEACKKGYAFVKNECLLCDENGKALTVIIMLCGNLIYLVYVLVQEEKCSGESADTDVAMMKILVNHISIFVILTAMKVDWSEFYKDFLTISSVYVSTSPTTIFSFDCIFLWSADEKIEYTIIMAGLAPIALALMTYIAEILGVFISSVYKFVVIRRDNKTLTAVKKGFFKSIIDHPKAIWKFHKFFSRLVIIFLNIYPQILVIMFNVLSCKHVDETDSRYLAQFPWVLCNSEFHSRIRILGISLLIFWGVLFPLGITRYTYKSHKIFLKRKLKIPQLKESTLESYLVRGYKHHLFWWEIVIFIRKVILLCLVTFAEEMDIIALGGIAIMILAFFLALSLYVNPYESKMVNILENFSLLVSTSSLGFGIISNFGSDVKFGLQIICYSVFISSNLLFLLIWTMNFIKLLYKELYPKIRLKLKYYFASIISKKRIKGKF